MYSDVSVIQSVNHPQVPVWIDFSLRAKKNISLLHIRVGPFLCGVVFPPCLQETFSHRHLEVFHFPISTRKCKPLSQFTAAQRGGAARHGRHRGVLVLPLEGRGVCVRLCVTVLSLCMHACTVEPFTDLSPHFPALAPHRYGNGAGVAASKESGETVMQIFY